MNKKDEVTVKIGDTEIKNSEYQKLLGIKVDSKLNINEHLNHIISKASGKANALSSLIPYISLSKKKNQGVHFLTHNFITTPLFGCSIVVLKIITLIAI